MPVIPPATATKVSHLADCTAHAEWTVTYPGDVPVRKRVICFAVRTTDDTVVPLIFDNEAGFIRDASELGPYNLE